LPGGGRHVEKVVPWQGAGHDGAKRAGEADARLWGTAATVAWAVTQGTRVVRVHDVAEMSDVVRMVEAIRQAR